MDIYSLLGRGQMRAPLLILVRRCRMYIYNRTSIPMKKAINVFRPLTIPQRPAPEKSIIVLSPSAIKDRRSQDKS